MNNDDPLFARYRAEPQRQPRRPVRWPHRLFWLVLAFPWLSVCTVLLTWFHLMKPTAEPSLPHLTPAQRERIERCFEIGAEYREVLGSSLSGLRGSTHPYLHEAQRARLALLMRECGRDVRGMR